VVDLSTANDDNIVALPPTFLVLDMTAAKFALCTLAYEHGLKCTIILPTTYQFIREL
jgi:hypothetical protein